MTAKQPDPLFTALEKENLVLRVQNDLLKELFGARQSPIEVAANKPGINEHELLFGKLSLKQNAVLQLLMRGLSNKQISTLLGCADSTTKTHIGSVFANVGVHTRSQVVVLTKPLFDTVDSGTYLALTGLPLDWADDVEGPGNEHVTEMIRRKTR